MRKCAASMSRASRTPRATRWNGSRWSGRRYADSSSPSSSCIRMLTRSQRISHENLRLRDKAWLEGYERWFAARSRRRSARPTSARRRRCSRPIACAGVTLAQPHRRLADGDVFGEGRPARRFPSRASRRARDGRRRAGVRRDDLRLARCAHHARLPRPVERRAGGGLEAHRRFHPWRDARPRSGCSSAMPAARARPRSPGKASTSRSMQGNWPLISASALPYLDTVADPARDDARRHGPRARRFRRAPTHYAVGHRLRHCSNCIARTAICCRASCRR